MELQLANKTVFISGSTSGIGFAMAQGFLQEGAQVTINGRSEDTIHEAINKLKILVPQVSVSGIVADSRDPKAIENIYNQLDQVDILINNAGITRDNLMLRMSEEQWDQVIETNLKSVFNLTKQVIRPMMKNRSGSIINMSSVVGVFGNAGQANYAASKAGMIGFSKSIAKEIGSRGIRCNSIAPGFIETDMTDDLDEKTKEAFLAGIPMKRLGAPNEVADVCVFLGSDMSKYVSGQTISVCGALNT